MSESVPDRRYDNIVAREAYKALFRAERLPASPFRRATTWRRPTRCPSSASTNGKWTARFEDPESPVETTARSGPDLLRLVGTCPELRVKGQKTPEEQLSIEMMRRAQERRVEKLDALIAELGEHVTRKQL